VGFLEAWTQASAGEDGVAVLRFWLHFKYRTGAEEADVKFHKEIHLAQDDGNSVLFCPCESEAHRRELRDCGCEQDDAGFDGGEIAG
jgi:hypothetical protein